MSRSDWRTLILAGTVAFFLYVVRDILPPFVVAAVLSYVFSPLLDQMEKRFRLSRLAVVVLFFVVILTVIGAGGFLLIPPLIGETKALLANAPNILTGFVVQLVGTEPFELFGQMVDAAIISNWLIAYFASVLGRPGEAFHLISLGITLVVHIVLSLVLMFYFLLDRERIGAYLLRFIPPERRERVRSTAEDIHIVLASYVRGLLALVVLMSTVTWIGLTFIFHVRYALPLAIATGILEIIPLVGPVTAAIISATVGLGERGVGLGTGIAIFYWIARQVEDQVVMPIVLGKAVRLHPIAVIFAVLAGGIVAGVLGLLLAVPVAAAIKLIMDRSSLPPEQAPS